MKKILWLVIVAVIVGFVFFAWPSRQTPPQIGTWTPPPSAPKGEKANVQGNGEPFRGPVGAPFIEGPKEPPPK